MKTDGRTPADNKDGLSIASRGKQEIQLSLTNRVTRLYKCNGVADLLKKPAPHMCYHAELGRSM